MLAVLGLAQAEGRGAKKATHLSDRKMPKPGSLRIDHDWTPGCA